MNTHHPEDKAALRARLAARRRGLDPEQWRALSRAAQERVLALPRWREARQVLLYAAVRGEADTGLLLRAAWDAGKQVLLPRCRPEAEGAMDLAACAGPHELAAGAYGIPEPDPAACPPLDPHGAAGCAPDLAVLPGVGFDRQGYRLGYGGGYYDRLLAGPGLDRALVLGLAFGFQVVERLPRDPWDRPVQGLCTEKEIVWP